jgi:hypothetical protein
MSRVSSITPRELRELLKDYEGTDLDEVPIVFAYNYGDYSGTPAVGFIGEIEEHRLVESAYSQTGWAVMIADEEDEEEGDDENDADDKTPKVLVLSDNGIDGYFGRHR